ncbi:glycosyltransferase family 2 protein [Pseudobacteriovorax antillogorgiicola]|uniref:Glycosyltransferase, catalytic subunit of cellulose synthase and poly-beta-1,6-N-acetylglucosamine synthase n=1 Tax=Pseudobacteriovorax antillogorgiicola TaxID=1513793 RepID=A0A1Y6CPN6_9BACT|nr:glycosyltransferase [Pseudobacteriovorax antillogorgiicola]TCS42873.1 cellulose synthase/poly-beta-1,6-N-acetylglucosamine synthase-like glycosyltransferase [Pseudobacteriovorax antillogorgiicola]SMF82072.1 Glycosyltransferase, catalytic subunit of cellulose synthase and poly-beta-1,6-N-acetylglucosamine synthase [Pseudobacteriovorax antillogorgiicola]
MSSNNPLFSEPWFWLATVLVIPYIINELIAFAFVLSRSLQIWVSKFRTTSESSTCSSIPSNLSISVVVPAHNEALVIAPAITSILDSHYKNFEVIVVNDGSQDQTLQVLKDAFSLEEHPIPIYNKLSETPVRATFQSRTHDNLKVLHKKNLGKGKADALNCGIGYARYEHICVVDADSTLESNSLELLSRPFIERPETIAVGGSIRSRAIQKSDSSKQASFNPLEWAQRVEYARIFYLDRVALSSLNLNYIISGAFGLFRRDALLAVGAYESTSLAEDMDLTLKLHRYYREQGLPYHIGHVPEANCWTQVPFDLANFQRQRARWQAGFIKSFFNNKDIVFSKNLGPLGLAILPYCMISLFEPAFALLSLGLTVAGAVYGNMGATLLASFLICHALFSSTYLWSIYLEQRHRPKDMKGSTLKNYLAWLVCGKVYDMVAFSFRVTGYIKFFRKEHSWGKMERLRCASAYCGQPLLERAEA